MQSQLVSFDFGFSQHVVVDALCFVLYAVHQEYIFHQDEIGPLKKLN